MDGHGKDRPGPGHHGASPSGEAADLARVRALLAERERQQRFVTRLSGTGGWTLLLAPPRLEVSPEWCDLHGFDCSHPPSLLAVLRMVAREDLRRLLAALRRCAREGGLADETIRSRHVQGHWIWLRMVGEAVCDDRGRLARIEGACQDVSPQVLREQELARHRDRLEELVEQRTRDLQTFSYALAHDLRAPIVAMSGFAQALADDPRIPQEPQVQHRLRRIAANGLQAEALVEGILALISDAQLPLHKEPVRLDELAGVLLEQFRAADPGREVEVHVEPGLVAQADRRLVTSVLANLLSNAWKFTAGRQPGVIRLGRAGPDVFYVQDNGAGFDMAFAEGLFEPLKRLHDRTEFPGLGVGLASARRILQRHGGRIWADAAPGQGATFWFGLPEGDVGPG